MATKYWIKKAVKRPGALRKALKTPAGKNIPTKKLNAAVKKGGKLAKMANLAKTLKKLKK